MPANRSGASSGGNVLSLRELRRELKRTGGAWPSEMARGHRDLARKAANWSQDEATAMGGVQAKAAGAIKGRGTAVEARIQVVPGARTAMANVAFWGAKRQTGWYGAMKYEDSAIGVSNRQHPPWVGNTWDVAVRGQGPYAINWALAKHFDELLAIYQQTVYRIFRGAFPD